MKNVKPGVKETVKKFTKDYVSEVVRESTKKLIKDLIKERKATLEAELKNKSAEEIQKYFDENSEFNEALQSTIDSTKEASLEEIQMNFENNFSNYLPPQPPSFIQRVAHGIKPFHAGIIGMAIIAVIIALLFSNAAPEILSVPNGPASGDNISTYSFSTLGLDKDGNNIKYMFDWGDGTTSETDFYPSGSAASALHRWSTSGTYDIRVMAIDAKGAVSGWSDPFSINIASQLITIANGPYSGTINVPISFTGSAFGGPSPYSFSWNFGDGGSSDLQNPTHAYSSAGTYTATLTVTDDAGRTARSNAQVAVVSQFTAMANGPYTGTVDAPISFVGSASGGTSPYSYLWNFGNGGSSNLQNPPHSYPNAGSYIATLFVTDSAGRKAQSSAQVNVVSKLIAYAYGPNTGIIDAPLSFNGSASGGSSPYSYSWNFGVGSPIDQQSPTHVYSYAKTYNVILTVKDSAQRTAQSGIQVNIALPLTAIADMPSTGTVNVPVYFTGSASGGFPPYSYSWTFGNGGSSTVQYPTNIYTYEGTFPVSLTVTDSTQRTANDGAQVAVAPELIAIASAPTYSCTATISFSGSATGGSPPYSYKWYFGDGGSSTLQNPSHQYSSLGPYTVSLTVTDSAGRTAQNTIQTSYTLC